MQTWGGMEFVHIPAGKFLMGSMDDNRLAQENEKPRGTRPRFRMIIGWRVTL